MGDWHKERLRVRYEETDTMGVVYYGKFFVWMEVGRVALLRDVGFSPSDWDELGVTFPVVQAHADYKASAKFDDEVLVRTKIATVGNSSLRFENEIFKLPEMRLLATGHTVHVMTRRGGGKVPFTPELKSKLTST